MLYPITLIREGNLFCVTFPDIPEAITSGKSREDALEMGLDALITCLDFYYRDGRPIPEPSPIAPGADYVELPARVARSVREHNAALKASAA